MGNDISLKYKLPVANLYGLVVCGGNSSRMGTDKSMLVYHQKPQRYHLYEMLQPFCEQVFISCNTQQANTIKDDYLFLADHSLYNNIGPMAALLTAFTKYPGKNMLIIGCDYPFLTASDLQFFLSLCKEENQAIAFYNEAEDIYEPLLGWYPASSFDKLKKLHEAKPAYRTGRQYSLQHFLRETGAKKFYPDNKNSIVSIDTYEAFIKACKLINQ